jgi:hypothetical protein
MIEVVFQGETSGGETVLIDLFDVETVPDGGEGIPVTTGGVDATGTLEIIVN